MTHVLPTQPESAATTVPLKALLDSERRARRLLEVLWEFADENGCFCATKTILHDRRCAMARSILVTTLEEHR